MTKRVLLALTAATILLFVSWPVSAEEATVSSQQHRLQQLRQNLELKREQIQTQRQERKATVQAALSEKRKEHIRNLFSRLIKRLEATIGRLEDLITRIESRLEKIEASQEGLDIAAIKSELQTAKERLISAQTVLTDASASLEEILDSDNPRESFNSLQDLIKGIKSELQAIHQSLVQIIGKIRGLRVGEER